MKLGQAYEGLDDCAGAIDAYMDVVRLYYHHPGAEAALQRLYQGDCHRPEGLPALLATAYTKAPDFRVVDVYGDSLELTDFQGSVVLMYYANNWSEQRVEELDMIASWHERFHSAGLQFIYLVVPNLRLAENGQTYHDRNYIVEAVQKGGYSFPVAFDVKGVGRSKYGAKASGGRDLYVIDRLGRLRLRQVRAWTEAEIDVQNQEALELVARVLEEDVAAQVLTQRLSLSD